MGNEELSQEALKSDGSPFIQGLSNEFGIHTWGIASINKGQTREENVHRWAQGGAEDNSDHEKQVAPNGDQADNQKEHKQNPLHLGVLWKSQHENSVTFLGPSMNHELPQELGWKEVYQ